VTVVRACDPDAGTVRTRCSAETRRPREDANWKEPPEPCDCSRWRRGRGPPLCSYGILSGHYLAVCLPLIPASEVRSIISQIASPDLKLAKLLDFGVLRPLDLTNVTDEGDQLKFVGALQYTRRSFSFAKNNRPWKVGAQSPSTSWAQSCMLMRKPLFSEFTEPYARLVRAAETEVPRIDSTEAADADLRLHAQNCLAKVASQRLDTVKWEDFSRPKVGDPMEAARRRIAQHRVAAIQARKPLW
jgi:hypothetical protein